MAILSTAEAGHFLRLPALSPSSRFEHIDVGLRTSEPLVSKEATSLAFKKLTTSSYVIASHLENSSILALESELWHTS